MKALLLLLPLLAGLTVEATAGGGPAAKTAMRTLARQRGASWLDRIVQISGDRGRDQPGVWHIVAADAGGGLREFLVGAKGIVSEGPVPAAAAAALQGPLVAQKKFTLDSTFAFVKAEAVAKKSRIGYDSATYRLRSPGPNSAPVWYLQLNNALGQKVADVTVSASSGRIAQFVAYNPAPPPPPAPPPSPTQVAVDRTREVVKSGTASVGRGLSRAGGWIRSKVGSQGPPPPYYVPPPSR